ERMLEEDASDGRDRSVSADRDGVRCHGGTHRRPLVVPPIRLHVAPGEDAYQPPARDDRQLSGPACPHELGGPCEALARGDHAGPGPHDVPCDDGPAAARALERAARLYHRLGEGEHDLLAIAADGALFHLAKYPLEVGIVGRREHALRVRKEHGLLSCHVPAEEREVGLEQRERLRLRGLPSGNQAQCPEQAPSLVVLRHQRREPSAPGAPVSGEERQEPLFLLHLVTAADEGREELDCAREPGGRDRRATFHLCRQRLDCGDHLTDHRVVLAQPPATRHTGALQASCQGVRLPLRVVFSRLRGGSTAVSQPRERRRPGAPKTPWQPPCRTPDVMRLDEMLDRCRRLEERASAIYRAYAASSRTDPVLCALWT